MSDIWHKPYEEKPDTDNHLVIKDFVDRTNELGYFDDEDMVFRTYTSGNVYDDEDLMEWCDIDELVAELDRTRKALDVAVDALNYANKCIKGGCVNWETHIDKALEIINQKEEK